MTTNDTAAASNLSASLSSLESSGGGDDFLTDFDTQAPDSGGADVTPEATDDIFSGFDDEPKSTEKTQDGDGAPSEEGSPEKKEGEEEDDFPDTAPGKGSEAAQKGWKEIKSELKKTRAELRAERDEKTTKLAELEKELAELRRLKVELPEIQEKAKLADEAERELAVARVEGTREYKETIDKPLKVIEEAAVLIAENNNLKVDDILDALAEPDVFKQKELLKDLTAGLDPTDSFDLIAMSREARAVLTKRAEIRARAAEAQKELERITQEKETKAQKKAREDFESAAENAINELKKRIPIISLAEGENADAIFDVVLSKAKATDFDKATPSSKAFAAAAAVLLPRVTKQNVHLQAEIKKLQARIAESNKTRPTVGGNEPQPSKKEEDFLDAVLGSGDSPYKLI